MRKVFLVILLSSSIASVHAQFSMEEFLANSVQAIEIKSIQNQQKFVDKTSFKSPLLREVEFRARQSRLTEGLSDYRLRFSPINPFERNANKEFKQVLDYQMGLDLKWRLNEVLKNRYQIMIEHYLMFTEQTLLQEKTTYFNELLALVRKQPDRFSIKDIIRIDKSLVEARLKIEEISSQQQQIEFLIKQTYAFGSSLSWEGFQLVQVEQIKQWIEQRGATLLENNLYLQSKQHKLLLDASELKIKRKEAFSNLGYLQAEYRTDNDREIKEKFGFQIGLTIPITNPDRPDLNRREFDMIESTFDLEEDKQSVNSNAALDRIELNSLIRQYEVVSSKKKEYMSASVNLTQGANSIEDLTELREYQYELKALELDLYGNILERYIDLLAFDGLLASTPYINYLSLRRNNFTIDLTSD